MSSPGSDFNRVPLMLLRAYVEALSGSELFLLKHTNTESVAALEAGKLRERELWSYDASDNLHSVKNLDVRSQLEGFRSCRVLESVEFGVDSKQDFTNSIEVTLLSGKTQRLALDEDARIATFRVAGGSAAHADGSFWPTDALHDHGYVHAFLYEVAPTTGEIKPGLAPGDAEHVKFTAQLNRLREENKCAPDEQVESLFTDDAWRVIPISPEIVAQVAGALDEAMKRSVLFKDTRLVSAAPHRILVCTMLSLHKTFDDFTPGPVRSAFGARLYPVVMVNSTHPLSKVRAGVRHVRPATTTIDGNASGKCHCPEMSRQIGALLVSDSNRTNVAGISAPIAHWNHLFEYYLPEPEVRLNGAWVQVVNKDKRRSRVLTTQAIRRHNDGRNNEVQREARQFAFDNVHMAPRMKMPTVTEVRPSSFRGTLGYARPLTDGDRDKWHFNDVVMAPICAHDCFHYHWRWGAQVISSKDTPSMGWANGLPYQVAGAPLVPTNQDVFIRLPNGRTIEYVGVAFDPPSGDWQIINHHGADYVLETGTVVDGGRTAQDLGQYELGDDQPDFYDDSRNEPLIPAIESWAVFYWRNRWYIETTASGGVNDWTPKERVEMWDLDVLLTENYRSRRG